MPKPPARRATAWPIEPKPTRPRVAPWTSRPKSSTKRHPAHDPARSACCVSCISRDAAMIRPKARSAVVSTRASPEVSTPMPRDAAPSWSMASEPAPATAITRSRGIRARTVASTLCVGAQISASASASAPGSPSISVCPASGSRHPSRTGVASRILAIAPRRGPSPAGRSGLQPVRPAVEEGHLALVVLTEHLHEQARQPEAEAAVRWGAEAEEVEVVLDRRRLDALVLGLGEQLLVAVLSLRAGGELDAAPQQVEAPGQRRLIGVAHVVEGPHGGGVVGHEGELVALLLLDDLRKRPLARRVEVLAGARRLVAALAQQLLRPLERDPGEGQRRHEHLGAERGLDLLAVRLLHLLEHVRQPSLLEGHHVLVGVDPGDLHVDARELGVVA